MYKDHLQFNEQRLANGITVYSQNEPVPYTRVAITVPVGTAHNTGEVIPGTAHFLEHLIFERANETAKQNDFSRKVGLLGGWANAYTRTYETSFELSIPTKHLASVLPDFFQLIFFPQFTEQDVALHRGIIQSERRGEEPWYPGKSEQDHYLLTGWKRATNYPIEQLYGGDADLEKITAAYLAEFHKNYLDPRIRVVAIGSGDITSLIAQLSKLNLSQHNLATALQPDTWTNKEFHTKSFPDLNRYEYYFGGFMQIPPKPELTRAVHFILRYLTNPVHGMLHEWLRNEQGWAYEVSYSSSVARWIHDWALYLPLDSTEHVETVRRELRPRIEAALRDKKAVAAEVNRVISIQEAYPFETVDAIIEEYEDIINTYGQPIDETTWRYYLAACENTDWLWRVYEYAFAPERVGEVCLIPEED